MLWDELIKFEPLLQKLLSGMPADIKSRCIIKKFREGSTVVKKEDGHKCVFILVKGELKVVNEFESGNIFVFASITPISFVGELEILSDENENAVTLQAVNECIMIQINTEDFMNWIQNDNVALMAVAKGLAKKMYPTAYDNGIVLFQSGIHKVQSYLIKYCTNKINDSEPLRIDKNRQQIADEVGISVKSINRSVKKLKESGLITITKGKIYINKSQYKRLVDEIVNECN